MHKTGIGLMGIIAIGMMLSSVAAAEDQTQPAAGQAATTQTSTDGTSAARQPAGQAQDTQQGAAAPAQAPANNAAPAETPATPAATAPAKKAPDEKPADDKPAAAKPAPAKKSAADKANPAAATATTAAATVENNKPAAKKNQPGKTYKVAACPDLNAPQVAELIKQDYTQNRFPHTDDDKKALGGDTIVAQVNPEDITGSGDSWQAPLKIRGQTADRAYAVNLDCEKGEISYSLQQ
ncbi:YebF family protein [Acerihabitans sp.]|uniref:YebF family protein n=1 Tax=Acerihabitans sp. TaxID=2811394 RepID=UPI002ED7FEF9